MKIVFLTVLLLVVYGHFFFPAFLAVVGGVFGRRHFFRNPQRESLPLSLIIPAFNEATVIEAKITNALASKELVGQLDILIASDGSSDRTVGIARQFEDRGVQVLAFEKNRGKASVVNDAVSEATGEVICLCDANVMFKPDALQKLVARLDDPNVGAASQP